jgi:regulator of sigma E protease
MTILSTLFYFIITIGFLVIVHEFGHFIAAISCGMRAEVFAFGMGNRLFGWNKKTKFTFGKLPEDLNLQGDTDYRVAMLPIGGYVKIAGMIDESMDTEFLKQEPQPWEFRSKPIWQRMIVISAGVIMNLLLAIIIFWGITYSQGESYMQTTEIGVVVKDSPAEISGLMAGDKILSINKKKIEYWEAIQFAIYFDNFDKSIVMEIERGGIKKTINIVRSNIPDISESTFGIRPNFTEPVISEVFLNKPADKAGLKSNDVILTINSNRIFSNEDVVNVIRANPSKEVKLQIKRADEIKTISVTPSSEGLIGISISSSYNGPILQVKSGLFEAFPKGVNQAFIVTSFAARSIYQIAAGKAEFSKSMGGPIKIAQMAKSSADSGFLMFLRFIGLLSMSLALINILPFPPLDGGHLVFLTYEAVFRRELPSKVRIVIQQTGFILVLVLMAFILYNDVINF